MVGSNQPGPYPVPILTLCRFSLFSFYTSGLVLHMNRLFIYYCQDEIQENIGLLAVGKNMVSTRTIKTRSSYEPTIFL